MATRYPLGLIERAAARQQFYREEEEAVRKNKTPQPGRGVSVPLIAVSFKAEKPQTEEHGLRYWLLA